MNKVYLSLGTNIGDRMKNLQQAVGLLMEMEEVNVTRISSIYETEPVGYTEQPSFLNISLLVESELSPFEMLKRCQSVENELGRVREMRWGPRIIDLDILLYNQETIEVEKLIVPHPRMFERAFVLAPLLEIAQPPYTPQLEKAKASLMEMDLEREGIKVWKVISNIDEFLVN